MNSVIWRLHRDQARFAAAAFAVAALVIILSGLRMAHTYHVALATCAVTHTCADLTGILYRGDGLITDLVSLSTLTLPGLLGLFWGAPLLAKEFEEGTHVLAWTQAIPRRRWIGMNLLWALVASATLGAAMSALVTWWRIPENALYGRLGNFDIQGFVPIAYCVFAVALGIAAGALFARVLPALAVTLGVLVVVRGATAIYLRPRLLTPVRVLAPLTGPSGVPAHAWLLSKDLVDPAGRVIGFISPSTVPAACSSVAVSAMDSCMQARGFRTLVVFQPDGRFWTFQTIETGIFLALAVPLVVLAYRRVCRGDA